MSSVTSSKSLCSLGFGFQKDNLFNPLFGRSVLEKGPCKLIWLNGLIYRATEARRRDLAVVTEVSGGACSLCILALLAQLRRDHEDLARRALWEKVCMTRRSGLRLRGSCRAVNPQP